MSKLRMISILSEPDGKTRAFIEVENPKDGWPLDFVMSPADGTPFRLSANTDLLGRGTVGLDTVTLLPWRSSAAFIGWDERLKTTSCCSLHLEIQVSQTESNEIRITLLLPSSVFSTGDIRALDQIVSSPIFTTLLVDTVVMGRAEMRVDQFALRFS